MVSTDLGRYTGYMNGKWVPATELKIDIRDRGVKGGDTVFDVARTFNGKSFRMKQHVDRLYRSLKYARIRSVYQTTFEFLNPEERAIYNETAVTVLGEDLLKNNVRTGVDY